MLTVNYITDDGTETVFEASQVQRLRTPAGPGNEFGRGVLIELPSGNRSFYEEASSRNPAVDCPEIFVMNSAGKTVARWPL